LPTLLILSDNETGLAALTVRLACVPWTFFNLSRIRYVYRYPPTPYAGLAKAREAAEFIAGQLDDQFDLQYRWNGNTLHFERFGVSGRMEVSDSEIRLHVRLGFLLSPLKSRFERRFTSI